MRELTVRIRFTKHSLGNVKDNDTGRLCLPRNPQGFVLFLPTWHRANLRMAAQVLGKHQDEVEKVCWDLRVDGDVRRDPWFRRYYATGGGKKRYVSMVSLATLTLSMRRSSRGRWLACTALSLLRSTTTTCDG